MSIMNVYRHIDQKYIQFDFAVHTDQPCYFDDEIRKLGGRIFSHPKPREEGFRNYGKNLKLTLKEHGPFSGVHSHVHYFTGYILYIAKKAGIPLRIAHSHNTHDGELDTLPRKVYRFYMHKLINRYASHLIGCSNNACKALFGINYWKDTRASVLPNALELSPFKFLTRDKLSLRNKLSLPEKSPLIGHVGRFAKQKNHRFLIEIFSALHQYLPSAYLVLVGDGPLRSMILDLIRKKGIDSNVILMGVRDDIPEILGALDLLLFPSLHEGLPLVLVESQAAGLPCIVANTVTIEADLKLGLVKFITLNNSLETWVDHIIESLNLPKPDWFARERALKEAGYDIKDRVKWIEKIYYSKSQ